MKKFGVILGVVVLMISLVILMGSVASGCNRERDKYDLDWIKGKSSAEISGRYGEFDRTFSGEGQAVRCAWYVVSDGKVSLFKGEYAEYLRIEFDDNMNAVEAEFYEGIFDV